MGLYYFEQAHSPRLWTSVRQANTEWTKVKSCRIDVVKEQLLTHELGLEIKEAKHPWSRNGYTYTADELFRHLVNVVLPIYVSLKRRHKLPTTPSVAMFSPPETAPLGTMSELGTNLYKLTEDEKESLRIEAKEERDRREERGEGDRWSERQSVNPPEINKKMIEREYRIEMRFGGTGDGGDKVCNWYHGKVTKIINKKDRKVEITWDDDCLHDDETETMKVTVNVLKISMWNRKTPVPGCWREYLTD